MVGGGGSVGVCFMGLVFLGFCVSVYVWGLVGLMMCGGECELGRNVGLVVLFLG